MPATKRHATTIFRIEQGDGKGWQFTNEDNCLTSRLASRRPGTIVWFRHQDNFPPLNALGS